MPVTTKDATSTVTSKPWSAPRWAGANAAGLATAFVLLALVGGTVEALGAEHDGLARDLSVLVALAAGAGVWAYLRQRSLLSQRSRVLRVGPVAAAALVGGFLAGFVIGGPPLDFVVGIFSIGAIGGAAEWSTLRHHLPRPGRMAAVGTAGWLFASIAAIVPAALLGDIIDASLGGGVAGFAGVLLVVGLVGGATGGALEGLALRSRVERPGR